MRYNALLFWNLMEEMNFMEYEMFERIVGEYKSRNPILFGLEHDDVCSAEQIEDFEKMLRLKFPRKYKQFPKDFGGGFFGYVNVYSLDKKSNFCLLAHNDIPIGGYLRIADNGCGDYYLLKIDNKNCLDQLYFYEHDTKAICDTQYADILEYLVKVGLKAKDTGEMFV